MTRPDLSRLSPEEKDALILALLDRVAALEVKLNQPPKTPDNSSVPPSRGPKANWPPRPKKPRRKRQGPGVTRHLSLPIPPISSTVMPRRAPTAARL